MTCVSASEARNLVSASTALKGKAQAQLQLLAVDPYLTPSANVALAGDPRRACSRRLNNQHRLIDPVLDLKQQ